jgi:hypothetical protein
VPLRRHEESSESLSIFPPMFASLAARDPAGIANVRRTQKLSLPRNSDPIVIFLHVDVTRRRQLLHFVGRKRDERDARETLPSLEKSLFFAPVGLC